MGVGRSRPEPGSGSIRVRFRARAHTAAPTCCDAAYGEALQGYLSEVEWRQVVTRLTAVATGAGRDPPRALSLYILSILGLIVGWSAGASLTAIGFGVGIGWMWKVGIPLCVVGVSSIVALPVLQCRVDKASKTWCSAAIEAIDATLLPELRAKHPVRTATSVPRPRLSLSSLASDGGVCALSADDVRAERSGGARVQALRPAPPRKPRLSRPARRARHGGIGG